MADRRFVRPENPRAGADGWLAPRHGSLGGSSNAPPGTPPGADQPTEQLRRIPPAHGRPDPADSPTELIRAVPDDSPTELISPVRNGRHRYADEDGYYGDHGDRGDYADGYDDGYDGYDGYDDEYDYEYDDRDGAGDDRDGRGRSDRVGTVVKAFGELLLTAGAVVLLFVVYEVWITDLISAGRQADATAALDGEWEGGNGGGTVGDSRTEHLGLADGKGIAKLYIPSLGQDYMFTVIEGTTDDDLAIGPGHYTRSQLPGERGNFAVAGHRVGKGAPFNDIDLVQPCDAIVVETRGDWYVYRMLPLTGQADTWSKDAAANPLCQGANGEQKVVPLTGQYGDTTGRTIVDPSEGDVINPVPGRSSVSAAKSTQSLLTLTTCHPKFSNRQRMIVHAVLVKHWSKAELGGKAPAELSETN